MPTRQLVINEVFNEPSELRARYRSAGQTPRVLVPHRAHIRADDEVKVLLTLRWAQTRVIIQGQVRRPQINLVLKERQTKAFELDLSPKSATTLAPFLTDVRHHAGTPLRTRARTPVEESWGECRLPSGATTRISRVLDASFSGAFLATALKVPTGHTVLFRTHQGAKWLAGTVRWIGYKGTQRGFGVRMLLGRDADKNLWQKWFHASAGGIA